MIIQRRQVNAIVLAIEESFIDRVVKHLQHAFLEINSKRIASLPVLVAHWIREAASIGCTTEREVVEFVERRVLLDFQSPASLAVKRTYSDVDGAGMAGRPPERELTGRRVN